MIADDHDPLLESFPRDWNRKPFDPGFKSSPIRTLGRMPRLLQTQVSFVVIAMRSVTYSDCYPNSVPASRIGRNQDGSSVSSLVSIQKLFSLPDLSTPDPPWSASFPAISNPTMSWSDIFGRRSSRCSQFSMPPAQH